MTKKKNSAGGFVAVTIVLLLAVGGINSCVQSIGHGGQQDDSYSASIDDSGDAGYGADDTAETPATEESSSTADPLPPVTQADHVGETSEKASAELTAQGLLVAFADTGGNTLPSASGWSVVGEQPAAGATIPAGSTVRLILSPPPPPPPTPAPAPAPVPDQPAPAPGGGATALCNDGSLSYSAHHQGTCSHHGGVAQWYR